MKVTRLAIAALVLIVPSCFGDLTVDQKLSDFNQLVGLYAKNYGPYELKRDLYGFDLYNVQPWLARVKASKSDLEFYDICVKYVAGLRDSHDEFTIRSTYDAWMHFDGDLYDGKFLIDYIDRAYLARAKYPFAIGDELVSVDGVPVAELLVKFAPYCVNGASNLVSCARISAGMITERYQGWFPLANSINPTADVVVKRQTTGDVETYTVTWDVRGDAVTTAGLIPSPGIVRDSLKRRSPGRVSKLRVRGVETGEGPDPYAYLFSADAPEPEPDAPQPDYMKPLLALRHLVRAEGPSEFGSASGLSQFDSPIPVFIGALPAGFKLRLGSGRTDEFLSGTFPVGGKSVGYIRIPSMVPANYTNAYNQFATEILTFEANTAGLVVDVMANGGGDGCYAGDLAAMLIPGTFQTLTEELRATLSWKESYAQAVRSAKAAKAQQWIIDDYQFMVDAIDGALTQNRARTGPLPSCRYTADSRKFLDSKGAQILYSKPIVVLTDNFTLSAAEIFTMHMQDYQRATIVGTTTDGGGGSVVEYDAGAYSEGLTRVTLAQIPRLNPVAVPGFPSIQYYDGVGIYPDVWLDYMTAANLASGGSDFVNSFIATLATMIQ